jgi:hypothetical protein
MDHDFEYPLPERESSPDLDSEEPKRSPIRRRNRLPNDDFDPNTKRTDKKKRHRQKNDHEHNF